MIPRPGQKLKSVTSNTTVWTARPPHLSLLFDRSWSGVFLSCVWECTVMLSNLHLEKPRRIVRLLPEIFWYKQRCKPVTVWSCYLLSPPGNLQLTQLSSTSLLKNGLAVMKTMLKCLYNILHPHYNLMTSPTLEVIYISGSSMLLFIPREIKLALKKKLNHQKTPLSPQKRLVMLTFIFNTILRLHFGKQRQATGRTWILPIDLSPFHPLKIIWDVVSS